MQTPQELQLQQQQQLRHLQQLQQQQQHYQQEPVIPASAVNVSSHEMMPISSFSQPTSTSDSSAPSATRSIPIPDPVGPGEILAASRRFRFNAGPFEWLASKASRHSSNMSQVRGAHSHAVTATLACAFTRVLVLFTQGHPSCQKAKVPGQGLLAPVYSILHLQP
jgi:hypothetical protein